jgi:hypothetical protein
LREYFSNELLIELVVGEAKTGLDPMSVTKSLKLKYYLGLSDEALGCNLSDDFILKMKADSLREEARLNALKNKEKRK